MSIVFIPFLIRLYITFVTEGGATTESGRSRTKFTSLTDEVCRQRAIAAVTARAIRDRGDSQDTNIRGEWRKKKQDEENPRIRTEDARRRHTDERMRSHPR